MKYYPALLCTTLFYKALLRTTKYFSVQSTTFNITKHYKVLHKVSTTKCYKILLRTAPHDNVLQSTAPYYPLLICLIVATHETSLHYAEQTLEGKIQRNTNIHVSYSCNTRDVIYTARSNTSHPPTSPEHCEWNCRKARSRSENDLTMIREWSDHEPVSPENWDYISIETNMSRSCYHSKFHKLLPLPRKVTVQLHQILPLPRKISVQLDCNFTKHCACHEKWHSHTILWLY